MAGVPDGVEGLLPGLAVLLHPLLSLLLLGLPEGV